MTDTISDEGEFEYIDHPKMRFLEFVFKSKDGTYGTGQIIPYAVLEHIKAEARASANKDNNKNFTAKEIATAIKKLRKAAQYDTEVAHGEADDVLCSLLPKEIVDEYNKIPKWYA